MIDWNLPARLTNGRTGTILKENTFKKIPAYLEQFVEVKPNVEICKCLIQLLMEEVESKMNIINYNGIKINNNNQKSNAKLNEFTSKKSLIVDNSKYHKMIRCREEVTKGLNTVTNLEICVIDKLKY